MITVLMISELIEKLVNMGIKFYIGESGEIRINLPDPMPTGAHSLLAELKSQKAEVIEYLQWDEPRILALLREALGRIKQHYHAGTLPWAVKHSLERYRAVKEAEVDVVTSYQAQDMVGFHKAVTEYERVFNMLINVYSGQLVIGKDEVIATFECSRVWDLPLDKAVNIETAFTVEEIRWNT